MTVHQCRDCSRLFGYLPRGVCAGCLDEREDDYRRVRDWLRGNPGASVVDVSVATGVTERRISLFIREGRLTRRPGWDEPRGEQESGREAIWRAAAGPVAPLPPTVSRGFRTGAGMRMRDR